MDIKKNITDRNITYERYYYNAGYRFVDDLQGYFTQWDETFDVYDQLVIAYEEAGRQWGSEVIWYANDAYTCAVLYVFKEKGGGQWFELRVTNSSILTGPSPDCVNKYNEHVKQGQKSRSPYSPMCQGILKE
ncbi:uncharacterized protein LOC142589087 [Dermacentor variabilis]|uniref:uncharacterized protein LOC142589087 n=1 Tax=Dermacentor variabilis TaxID=34621 RepID=UPI003F5BD4B7